jgi:hypothetical protein
VARTWEALGQTAVCLLYSPGRKRILCRILRSPQGAAVRTLHRGSRLCRRIVRAVWLAGHWLPALSAQGYRKRRIWLVWRHWGAHCEAARRPLLSPGRRPPDDRTGGLENRDDSLQRRVVSGDAPERDRIPPGGLCRALPQPGASVEDSLRLSLSRARPPEQVDASAVDGTVHSPGRLRVVQAAVRSPAACRVATRALVFSQASLRRESRRSLPPCLSHSRALEWVHTSAVGGILYPPGHHHPVQAAVRSRAACRVATRAPVFFQPSLRREYPASLRGVGPGASRQRAGLCPQPPRLFPASVVAVHPPAACPLAARQDGPADWDHPSTRLRGVRQAAAAPGGV